MSLSTVNQITSTVQFDNKDFSFTNTYGTMIQNRPYSGGYKKFELGLDTRDAFLYKALSATADEIGDIVYLNVRKYIDFVSNVDICKVKSLQSMLKLFGFNKTVFNCFDSFPNELLNLINVLSINKKQLMKAGMLKEELLSAMIDPDGNFYTYDDQAAYNSEKKLSLRKYFANNTYTLSTDIKCIGTKDVQIAKLNGLYQYDGQSLSCYCDVEDYIDEQQFSELSQSIVYRNDSGYFILEQQSRYFDVYTDEFKKVMSLDQNQLYSNLFADGDIYSMQMSSLTSQNSIQHLPVYNGDRQFISKNISSTVDFIIRNLDFTEDVQCISDQKYENYLSTLYSIFLRGQLLAKYNAAFYVDKLKTEYYVYPYLGSMYFEEDKSIARSIYNGFSEDDDNILSIKMYNHVPKSFNEQKIVDDIDAGLDELDNYTGAELSILNIEMQRRAAPLDWKKIGVAASSGKLSQTRYSYYREKKVAEYATFIDSYYTTIVTDPDIYDFDSNYYVINNNDKNPQHFVINQNIDMRHVDPKVDIDKDGVMVPTVAQYLAKLTLYITKIREKIKLQTQKNYMKGTNLLMIYVINEYLNEYASHNKNFFYGDDGEETLLSTVYNSLDGHQFANEDLGYTIEVDEFYDKTNYYNIKTSTTVSSLPHLADEVNDRYWELTSVEKPLAMQSDGLYYKLGTLQNFYLSTLGLKSSLVSCSTEDGGEKLAEFLCTIYDLGANDSFIYSTSSSDSSLSIFSTMLEDKQYAAQVYNRLVKLSSSYTTLNEQYLSAEKYKYPATVLSDQMSNVVSTYIMKNLSDEYLSGVSAVYNKHIKAVNSLSGDIDTLESDYNDFINGTYSFYYKKSGNKYCYSDYDIDAGIYQHKYFVGNDQYDNDSMSLYQHLYNLQQYSTEDNIHNFALSNTLSYVYDGFTSIYSSLNADVNSKIALSGFVDVKALTLDDELQYTYNYLKDYIDTRKQVLQNQLQSMQQQANSLKLQYETLNNAFTNAVANFNDSNDGYALGDDKIYCVSLNERNGNWTGSRCSRDTKAHKKASWCIYVTDNDTNRWYYEDDSGSYALSIINITPYNGSHSLEDRCNEVEDYMFSPTSMRVDYDGNIQELFKGLQREGIVAVCDNTKQGLADIQRAFNNLSQLASDLYGIDVDKSGVVDLYDRILHLIEQLTSIDQSTFDADSCIITYKKFLKTVIELSGQYLPVRQAYINIYNDSEQAQYLAEFYPNMDLTLESIENLTRYMKKKDFEDYTAILTEIDQFINVRFQGLLDTRDQLGEATIEDGITLNYFTGNEIELDLDAILQALVNDVIKKTNVAITEITKHSLIVQQCIENISAEVSASLGVNINFDTCVKSKIAELNFFDHDIYKNWVDVFLTYGGQPFCYDPYYNMRNVTHPSYQVHPYMWNYVKKMQGDSLIGMGFKSKVVTDIIEGQSEAHLKKYIGRYGQTIDTWRNYSNGAIDYSGYLTRWEMSEHTSPSTGNFNQIVDFDGAFYPPALDEYLKNHTACSRSVYDKMTKAKVQVLAMDKVSDDLSSYVMTDSTGKITSNTFYNAVSETIEQYCVSNDVKSIIDNKVNGTMLSSLTKSAVSEAVTNGMPHTFFENYYMHLNLADAQCQYIAEQMNEYYVDINSVTESKSLTDQYDIYKYGLDVYKNSYILFKKYDYSQVEQIEELTYRQKRNTLGRMWIRMAHTPLAFPAFNGSHPQYYIRNIELISTAILKLMKLKEDGITYKDKYKKEIIRVNDDMQYFYDFEMSQDRSSISYVLYNGDFYDKGSLYQQFELPWIASDIVAMHYDPEEDIEYLVFKNDSANNIDYIDFKPKTGMIANYRNFHDIADQDQLMSGVRYPSLIGYYVHDQSCIDFVYVYKKYIKHVDEDGKISYSIKVSGPDVAKEIDDDLWRYNHDQCPTFFIVQVKNGIRVTTLPDAGSETMHVFRERNMLPYSHSICVGYDQTQRQTVFAITVQSSKSLDNVTTETAVSCLNFNENTEGAIVGDPIAHEVNSHDVFEQNIVLVNYKRKNSSIDFSSCQDYNINADISYLPVYPGLSGEAKLYNKYAGSEYYNIELLGMSKDIDGLIKLVNPNPNPYVSYEDIISCTEFGRVYEDYIKEEDKTFVLLQNPSLNTNMSLVGGTTYFTSMAIVGDIGMFTLTYNLLAMKPYTQHDLSNIDMLVYNCNTLGKNPYYIGKLGSLKDETDMYYNDEVIDENNADSEISAKMSGIRVTVAGTHDKIGTRSITESNHIHNIDRFTAQADLDNGTLTLKFYFNAANDDVFVPQDCLRIMLYNTHDLTMFKYYHMLDAHGAVNCKYLSTLVEDMSLLDKDHGSWGIVYNKDKYAKYNELSDLLRSYYVDSSGGKTYLNDIELSDYDYLSDVYILQGNKRLSFKYDEELRFDLSNDLYYYPTLNLHYPTRAVDFITYSGAFSYTSTDNAAIMTDIFNSYNLFIIDLDSPQDVLSSIGQVDIPIIYNDVDDIRAYEDYLSVTVDDDEVGKAISSVPNYLRYDSGDPRAYRYVHFTSISTEDEPGGINKDLKTITVSEEAWTNKTTNEFLDYCKSQLSNVCPATSEELTVDFNSQYISITPTKDNCDISKQLKLYVNYKCNKDDNNKIDLYFNYFNWFDSPYIKIDNGTQILLDTIEGTYLKLSPGEDGILDIVLQFKYYVGDVLYGYKNVKALSYRIFNLSDDKPKFLVQKIYQTSPGENKYNIGKGKVQFIIKTTDIDLNQRVSVGDMGKADVDVYVDIKTNKTLSSSASFYLEYSNVVLDLAQDDVGVGYSIDRAKSSPGVVCINVTDTSIGSYKVKFMTKYDTRGLDKYANKKYLLDIAQPDIVDSDGNGCDIELAESYFSIVNKVDTSVHLLVSTNNNITRELIVTDILNNLVKLN